MAFQHASIWNGYMPKASKMVVAYALDPKTNPLNDIIQYVPSDKDLAIWPKVSRDDFVRDGDPDEDVWAEGDYSPRNRGNKLRHDTDSAKLIRRAKTTQLGEAEMKQFEFYELMPWHLKMLVDQMITKRHYRVNDILETSGNWAGMTDTATNLGGGKWDVGTEAAPYFAKSLNAIALEIRKQSNGQVMHQELICTLNPANAVRMGASQEIRQFLSRSEYALMMQKDPYGAVNQQFGLPRTYQAFTLRVNTAVRVSAKQLADGTDASTRAFIKTADSAYITTRPGGVSGNPGGIPFGTICSFYAADSEKFSSGSGEVEVAGEDLMLQVESKPDAWERLTELRVTEKMVEKLVAPHTGYLATAVAN